MSTIAFNISKYKIPVQSSYSVYDGNKSDNNTNRMCVNFAGGIYIDKLPGKNSTNSLKKTVLESTIM